MLITDKINELLKNYQWPCTNSITFGNGKMIILETEFHVNHEYSISDKCELTLDTYLNENPTDLTDFDVFSKAIYKNYEIFVGDGSYEGEGIVFVINKESNSLHWFAFFENSDSFNKVDIDNVGVINATTTNGVLWKIPIDDPVSIKIEYKN
jgi:hypothetical protein